MLIDAILVPRITGEVNSGHALQGDTLAVGKNEPVPHGEDATDPEAGGRVVFPDGAGALGDQQMMAGHRVEDVLADVAEGLARQIGVDPADQGAGDNRAGLHLVG